MRRRILWEIDKLVRGCRLLSTTAQGTAYEQQCMSYLSRHLPRTIKELKRIGRAGDEGVDLMGRIGPSRRLLIVQCKSTKPVVGPSAIRELEGTLGHQGDEEPLGILFGASGFSPATCERCATSGLPLMLLHLSAPGLADQAVGKHGHRGRLKSALMSRAAQIELKELIEVRRAIAADGEAFVRLQEIA